MKGCTHCGGSGYVHCGDNNTGVSYPCRLCEEREKIREILTLIDELGGGLLHEDPIDVPPAILAELESRGHVRRMHDEQGWLLTREGLAYIRWVLRVPLPSHLTEEHTKGGRI